MKAAPHLKVPTLAYRTLGLAGVRLGPPLKVRGIVTEAGDCFRLRVDMEAQAACRCF